MTKDKIKVITHDGTFHTDEVFACATIMLVFDNREIEIIRTRDENIINSADYVIDVGMVYDENRNRFDHHQKEGAGERDSKIPYASFGLVWKKFGEQLCENKDIANYIDDQLVSAIDAIDNGVQCERSCLGGAYVYSLGDIISSIRPTWQEDTSMDQAFLEATELAKKIISRILAHAKAYIASKDYLIKSYLEATDKRIVIIGKEYPGWYEIMSLYPEPLYAIYERSSGGWGVKAVRIEPNSFETRKPFPESWAGLRDKELQKITGVEDAVFAHNSRFFVVAESKEGAIKLAEKALLL